MMMVPFVIASSSVMKMDATVLISPKNVWHTLECIESATIFEVKEGPFVPHEEEGILDVKG